MSATKTSTVEFVGNSGAKPVFDVWPIDHKFKETDGAVYAVTMRYQNEEGLYSHEIVYFGTTNNVSELLGDHPKASEFEVHKANMICVFIENSKRLRSKLETDLINTYKPHCND
jgi:hypothetical protein